MTTPTLTLNGAELGGRHPSMNGPLPAMICRFGADLQLTYVNAAFGIYRRVSPQALIGTSIFDGLSDLVRQQLGEMLATLSPEQPIFIATSQADFPEGQLRWIEWTQSAVYSPQGQVLEYQTVGRDVTERERILQASEARQAESEVSRNNLNVILTTIQDAIMAMSLPDRRLLYSSASWEHVLGYPISAFLADPNFFRQVIHPDDFLTVISAMQACLRDGYTETDHRVIFPNGEVRWIHRRAWVTYDHEGHPIQIIDTARDITSRKQIEEELHASKEMYRSLIESADAAISMVDAEGRYLYLNPISAIPFGLPPDALVGKTVPEIFPPDQAALIMRDVGKVITENTGMVLETEVTLAGNAAWFRTSIQPVRDASGMAYAALIHASTITDKKHAEFALIASEEKYRSLIESSDGVISMFNAQGEVLYANKIAAQALGLTPETMVGKNQRDLFPPSIANYQMQGIREVMQTGQGVVHENISVIANQPRWFRTSIQPVRDAFGNVTAGLIHATDITRFKAVELSLRASEERFQAFMRHFPGAVSIREADGQVIYCNTAYLGWAGRAEAEIIGHQVDDYLPPDLAAHFNREHEQVLAAGHALEFHHDFPAANGTEHHLVIRFPIPQEGRSPLVGAMLLDITKEKRAEASLRASESRYRQMFELHGLPKLIIDPDNGRIVDANPAAAQFYGYGREAMRSLSVIDLNPAPPQEVRKLLARVKQGERSTLRVVHRAANGILRNVEVYAGLIELEGKAYIYALITDVTEKHQAQVALQESYELLERRVAERTLQLQEERNLLRTVIDTVPDFIYVKDLQHRMVLNNTAHARTLRIASPAEAIGKTDLELFPEALAAKFHADEDQIFATGQPVINAVERSIGEDGREIWALTTKVPLRNIQGELIGLVGITHDISEMNAQQAALRESEERYRTTVTALSEGIVVQDKDGAIRVCNAAAERILGLTAEQMMGRSSIDPRWQTIHEDGSPFPGETHPAMVTLRTGMAQSDVIIGVHKPDSSLTWIEVNSQPLIDTVTGHPAMVVVTFADITARREADQALKQALQREKELGELKSRFVWMASHEFRTPLAAILATTETLTLYRHRMDAARIDARLDKIRGQVNHMRDIMEDVLQLARIQAGKMEFNPSSGDLDALCRDIVEEFESLTPHAGRIAYRGPITPMITEFDRQLIRQVITNLLSNAIKYSPENTNVGIELAYNDVKLILKVIDHGIGIPPEDMKHLFEPFHRAGNTGTISGTGLGLSITKQAVDLHGGLIVVESALGVGTTFTVTLPTVQARKIDHAEDFGG